MEIKTLDTTTLGNVISKAARGEDTPAPSSRTEQPREKAESVRPPPPPKRPPPLVNTVTQSLNQAGISTAQPDAVPGVEAASSTNADNDVETSQNEKVAQALQAFMHALVQAANAEKPASETSSATQSVSQPSPQAETASPPPSPAANAYSGLVSRLEGLVQAMNGNSSDGKANDELARLDSAFRDLVRAGSSNGSNQSGAEPNLQTVLKNVIANLQSTGDPTLASTGNVINTSA